MKRALKLRVQSLADIEKWIIGLGGKLIKEDTQDTLISISRNLLQQVSCQRVSEPLKVAPPKKWRSRVSVKEAKTRRVEGSGMPLKSRGAASY